MRKIVFVLLSFCLVLNTFGRQREITVLQWNIWQEGTMVEGGFDAIVDEVARLKPDFVTFSEVRNYNNTRFCDRITDALKDRYNETYYSFKSDDTGLLSRYPIKDSTTVFPLNNDHGSIYRLVSSIEGQEFAVYTSHLDYLTDAYYNVRGYHGSTWQEIPIPTSVAEVLTFNDASLRDDAIRSFIKVAKKDVAEGMIVFLGGDFNEPSHLDWIRETKDLYDHHGLIIPWTVTLELDNAGFVDAYRAVYPDVIKYPGFTFPSDNELKDVNKLTWAPKADERDRIDYIFYSPHPLLKIKEAKLFGPTKSIVRSQRVEETSSDKFITPLGVWPTDHKGLLVKFSLKIK